MDGFNSSQMQSLSGNSENHHGKLACQSCQRKKIKCSRTFPCEQCIRSGLSCVPSTRKPRTRHAGKRAVDSELRSRITKLESLVESLSGEVGTGNDESPGSENEEIPEQRDPTAAAGKYIGSPFWSTLSTEVQALREALEEEASEDEAEQLSPATKTVPLESQGTAAEYDLILCPPGVIYVMPGALASPSPAVSLRLLQIFEANVDCLFRVFHMPSIRRMMTQDAKYLGHDADVPSNRAVKASIWFAATNSMQDSECMEVLGQSRAEMLSHFRRHMDIALSQADLLNTSDLAAVQALILYLACLRLTDNSRRVWMLSAVLVRLARGIGLNYETLSRSPFETEIRRRAWYGVRYIDVWSALDRASEPLIDAELCSTPMPSNVNDSEFDVDSTEIPNHPTGLTEMSFGLMAHLGCEYTARFNKAEDKPHGLTWQQRLELAQQFSKTIEERFLQYCDTSDPFQRVVRYIGKSMASSTILRAIRPVSKHVSSVPPPVHSPFVLTKAIECLKNGEAVTNDPDVQRWRWMVWVPWHALAITLAGLCFHRDSDLSNEAWPLVEACFERTSRVVADTPNGMLWRPLQKLYKKAVAFRDHGTSSSVDTSPSNPGAEPTPKIPPATSLPAVKTESSSDPSYPTPDQQFNNSATGPLPYQSIFPTDPAPGGLTLDPQLQLNHNGLPQGGMPTGGVDVDFNFNDPILASSMGFGNDMNWMDFERILEDMSNPAVDAAMGDAGWTNSVQVPSSTWSGPV